MLKIDNIYASIEEKEILKGLNIQVRPGEVHAIMGPNGAGKSTLAKVIAGHPFYEVTKGKVLFEGGDILELDPEERAWKGIFVSFQYPLEIAGVTNFQFLYEAYKAKHGKEVTEGVFREKLMQIASEMGVSESFIDRDLNEGFSGGEKKRNEILQMKVLDPKCAILDETDSGLDIDALKVVAEGVNRFMTPDKSLVLITHYQRLLDYIKPDFVHVMQNGKIVKSGSSELALELEEKGYAAVEA